MWKVDRWLIPWLCLLYLLSFLDRTNIGNARLARMEKDLHMGGHEYASLLSDSAGRLLTVLATTMRSPFSSSLTLWQNLLPMSSSSELPLESFLPRSFCYGVYS